MPHTLSALVPANYGLPNHIFVHITSDDRPEVEVLVAVADIVEVRHKFLRDTLPDAVRHVVNIAKTEQGVDVDPAALSALISHIVTDPFFRLPADRDLIVVPTGDGSFAVHAKHPDPVDTPE